MSAIMAVRMSMLVQCFSHILPQEISRNIFDILTRLNTEDALARLLREIVSANVTEDDSYIPLRPLVDDYVHSIWRYPFFTCPPDGYSKRVSRFMYSVTGNEPS